METVTGVAVRTTWRERLAAIRADPESDYFARSVMPASYVSATGEEVPRVRVMRVARRPPIEDYQYPVDDSQYRIAALCIFSVTTYEGGPPAGWQPPDWNLVHEERPNEYVALLGKAETAEPSVEIIERARAWIAAKEAEH